MGLPVMALPEAAGGAGASLTDLAAAVEVHGAHLGSVPLVETAVVARLLARIAGDAAEAALAAIVDGAPAALALRPAERRRAPAGARAPRRPPWWSRSTATGWSLVDADTAATPGRTLAGLAVGRRRPRRRASSSPRARRRRRAYAAALDEWRALTAVAQAGLARATLDVGRPVRQGPPPVRRAHRQLPGAAAPLRRPARPRRRQPAAGLRGRSGRSTRASPTAPAPRRAGRRGAAARWPRRRPGSASTCTAATASCSSTTCSCTCGGPRPPACSSATPATSCTRSRERRWGAGAPDAAARSRPPPPRGRPAPAWTSASTRRPRRSAPRCGPSSTSTSPATSSSAPSPPARCTTGASTRRSASGATSPPGWPTEVGGLGRSAIDQALLNQELYGSGAPIDGLSIASMVGATLLLRGTDEQRAEVVPRILAGEVHVLPRLQRARRRLRRGRRGHPGGARRRRLGDRRARRCSRRWPTRPTTCSCSARSNLDAPKHKGLTMFLVPMDTPGHRDHAGRDDGRRAHEHHLLQRRARARLVPRRRGRRRVERDARRPRLRAQLAPTGASPTTSWSRWPAGPPSPEPTAPGRSTTRPCGRCWPAGRPSSRWVGCCSSARRGSSVAGRDAPGRGLDGQAPHHRGVRAGRRPSCSTCSAPTGSCRWASPARCWTVSSSTPSVTRSSRRSTAAPARSSGRSSPAGASACPATADAIARSVGHFAMFPVRTASGGVPQITLGECCDRVSICDTLP